MTRENSKRCQGAPVMSRYNLRKIFDKMQGSIQRDFATSQPEWDPKFLSQIRTKLKILK